MPEAYAGLAADGPGKKIRNLQLTVLQTDGTQATVLMQVVSIGDENGNPVSFIDQADWQMQMLDEMRAQRLGIQMLIDQGQPVDLHVDLLTLAQDLRDSQTEI